MGGGRRRAPADEGHGRDRGQEQDEGREEPERDERRQRAESVHGPGHDDVYDHGVGALVVYAGLSSIGTVLSCIPVAYVISRMNWRGRPLISHEVIIDLIAATTTATGLAVKSKLDSNIYPAGLKVSDQQMAELQLRRDKFHGDWNYVVRPRSGQCS